MILSATACIICFNENKRSKQKDECPVPKSHAEHRIPDQRKAAVCGLFCPACTLYIGTQEDPERLKRLAQGFGRPVAEVACDGCRAERRCWYCRACALAACAAKRNIEYCDACGEYPCQNLRQFQAARPHRAELWGNLARIREVGYETWYQEQLQHYSCPECQTINSAYDLACRNCGNTPGSEYAARHRRLIEEYQRKDT
ncbi:DUF3795 domain-containing protein [candidate division FCPU426 bacterium]|nr:DUF3795 domain-containing protein [candidate division FCPU426 bacterium]